MKEISNNFKIKRISKENLGGKTNEQIFKFT